MRNKSISAFLILASAAPISLAQNQYTPFLDMPGQSTTGVPLEEAAARAKELTPNSCRFGPGIEAMRFELTLSVAGREPVRRTFAYETCEETPRDDLQAPYTTRWFKTEPDDFRLVIVTNDPETSSYPYSYDGDESDVLLYSREGLAGRATVMTNDLQIKSTVRLGTVTVPDPARPKGQVTGGAVLEASPAPR